MGSYSHKRSKEKASKPQGPTDEQLQREREERLAFREKVDAETHIVVWLDGNTKKFWRVSAIQREPRTFCREAGLTYSSTTGLNTKQIQDYLEKYRQQPTRLTTA